MSWTFWEKQRLGPDPGLMVSLLSPSPPVWTHQRVGLCHHLKQHPGTLVRGPGTGQERAHPGLQGPFASRKRQRPSLRSVTVLLLLLRPNQVVYKEKDSDGAVHFWTVEGNASHSVQLTGLGKYVLYEIQVLAFTRMGDGRPSSPPILERTLDDVPGPPVGILFPEVRTTSVRLIWQSPSEPNGIILG